MNYSDFGEIIEDEFTGSVFGKENQLHVLGWVEKRKNKNNNKHLVLYVVRCNICCKDAELYGDGLFQSSKSSLVRGQIPCGCSLSARRDEKYYSIICKRKADEMGYRFLGWSGSFTDRKTKIILECPEHGIWDTGIINNFVNRSVGCRKCKNQKVGDRFRKEDSSLISKFLATDCFHPDTVFIRSEKTDNLGRKVYWDVWCPECGESGSATASSLHKGSRCCGCSKQRPLQAYICKIEDSFGVVGIKFGISSNPYERIKRVNRESCYDVSILEIYKFVSVEDCRLAERECIDNLICGILPECDFPDGYTETTYPYNLHNIQKIYRKAGGINVFRS